MQIFVARMSGGHIALDVEPTDSIWNIKQKIDEKEGHDPDDQILIFARQTLDDDCTLCGRSIQKESTLHLNFRMGGGPSEAKWRAYRNQNASEMQSATGTH